MTPFKLEIITQEKPLLTEEVESLYVSTIDGDITVLAHHTPLVTVLKPGEIIVKRGEGGKEKEEVMASTGGILEVTPDKVVILADATTRVEEIDEAAAEAARERAEKLMQEKLSDVETAEVSAELQKALLQLKIVRKRRHHGGQ